MKIIKWLLIAVVLVVVLVVAGVFFAISRIDAIAKAAIERGGTHATGVQTTLDSAKVGLRAGTFEMSGLRIANPAGFKTEKFFTLGSGGVSVSYDSLQQPVVVLPTLKLSDLTVNLERNEGKTNYKVLLDNLGRTSSGSQPSKPPAAGGEEKKFVVNELEITNVNVRVDMIGLGSVSPAVNVPIERIRLTNVGKGQGGVADSGVTMGQLSGIVIQAVLGAAVDAGGGIIPDDILGDLKGQLTSLDGLKNVGVEFVGKAGEAARQLQSAGQNIRSTVDDATNKAKDAADELKKGVEGIRGLIPGKKD
ncbi:MAG: hypothetical protein KF864_09625 [Phycisphaeraceae bacterium]|nr:hypothetical protein [Phycisphaeraceae bacterium]